MKKTVQIDEEDREGGVKKGIGEVGWEKLTLVKHITAAGNVGNTASPPTI